MELFCVYLASPSNHRTKPNAHRGGIDFTRRAGETIGMLYRWMHNQGIPCHANEISKSGNTAGQAEFLCILLVSSKVPSWSRTAPAFMTSGYVTILRNPPRPVPPTMGAEVQASTCTPALSPQAWGMRLQRPSGPRFLSDRSTAAAPESGYRASRARLICTEVPFERECS